MNAHARHIAIRFILGGVIALLGLFLPFPLGQVAFFFSGVVGGASLKQGARVAVGFGIGFLVVGLVVPIVLVSLQGMSGEENAWGLLLVFAISFGVSFGLAGGIGAAFIRLNFRLIRASLAGFTVGGSLGGVIAALPFLLMKGEANYGGLGAMGGSLLLAGIIVGVLVPYLVGGSVLGVAVGKAAMQGNAPPTASA